MALGMHLACVALCAAAAAGAAGGGAAWGQHDCTSLDYTVVRGTCDTVSQTREVTWVKTPRLEVWNCVGPDEIAGGAEDCACRLSDFEARVNQGTDGATSTVEGYTTVYDAASAKPVCEGGMAVSLRDLLPTGPDLDACTVADMGFEYSLCDPATQMREVITYWTRQCVPGRVQQLDISTLLLKHTELLITRNLSWMVNPVNDYILIEPDAAPNIVREVGPSLASLRSIIGQELLVDLASYDPLARELPVRVDLPPGRPTPCQLECTAGMFLSPPMSTCGFCPKGTHSVRGSIYGNWREGAEHWPEDLHTRCYATQPDVRQFECAAWEVEDGVLHSGHQPSNRTVVSILEVITEIRTQPATLKFSYKMDFTEAAVFVVLINSKLVARVQGSSISWREETYNIPTSECTWRLALLPATGPNSDPSNTTAAVSACVARNMFEPSTPAVHFPYTQIAATDKLVQYEYEEVPGDGCYDTDYANATATGKLVFVHRTTTRHCPFVTKIQMAQKHGAVAVVVVDYNEPRTLHISGPSAGITIPFVSMRYAEFERVKAAMPRAGRAAVGLVPPKPGPAEIQFVMEKVPSRNPKVSGKVYIKEIEVEGTVYAAEQCDECLAGTYSTGGLDMPEGCAPCPADTHSGPGAARCTPCPTGQSSAPGSARCGERATCGPGNYVPVFGACTQTADGPQQRVTWVVEDCVEGTAAPPAPTTLKCGPGEPGDCIAPGLIRKADGFSCAACDAGLVPDKDHAACVPCAADEYLQHLDVYDGFARLNDSFTGPAWATGCATADCAGWDFASVFSEAAGNAVGLVAGASTTRESMSLTHRFNATHGGSLMFHYYANLTKAAAKSRRARLFFSLVRHVDDDSDDTTSGATRSKVQYETEVSLSDDMWTDATPDDEPQVKVGSIMVDFDEGSYSAKWEYEKQATDRPAPVTLVSLRVEGSAAGRGVSCAACPAGHTCVDGVSRACPPGTHRAAGARPVDVCDACDGTSERGAAACTPCGAALRAYDLPSGRRACRSPGGCRVELGPAVTYDLTRVNDARSAGGAAAGQLDAFHLNLCPDTQSPCGESLACMADTQSHFGGGSKVQYVSYGRSLELEEVANAPGGASARGGGILLTLTGGDACETDPFRQYAASVMVVCDPVNREQYTAHSSLVPLQSEDPCVQKYTVINPSGCVLCDEDHPPMAYWTPCANGTQERKIEWGRCYGLSRGEAGAETQTRACSTSDITTWLIPVIVGAVVFVGLCVFIAYTQIRGHNALKHKYQALSLDHNKDGMQGVQQAGPELFLTESPDASPAHDPPLTMSEPGDVPTLE